MRPARWLFLLALVLDLAGAGGALLVSARTWQTIRTPVAGRPDPDLLNVSGRTVDSASTALALVALAGVVAVLATRGVPRRLVGAVLALAGAGLVWRAILSCDAVGVARARSLVESAHRTVSASGVTPAVTTHGGWALLSGVAGALVAVAGVLIAWRGHRGQVMSTRYEAPAAAPAPAAEAADGVVATPEDQVRAATALWTALDRGEDPTR